MVSALEPALSSLLLWSSLAFVLNAQSLLNLNATTPTLTTTTERARYKAHVESTVAVTGSDPLAGPISYPRETPTPQDVGSIIVSMLPIHFTVHLEASATDFLDQGGHSVPTDSPSEEPNTTKVSGPNPTQGGDLRPHLEATADEFGDISTVYQPHITPPPAVPPIVTIGSQILRPVPATSIDISGTTIVGRETVTLGDGSTKVHLDPSGNPVIVDKSSTTTLTLAVTIGDTLATPIPSGLIVTSTTLTRGGSPVTVGSQTISINEAGEILVAIGGVTSTVHPPATRQFSHHGITATAVANDHQYVIGSSTLAVGQAITVDNTFISLTTDSTGAIVLVADGSSTTLAPAHTAANVPVITTVVSGTTQYIIGSQTLAPGHPITLDRVPMSITTSDGATILVVGEKTTTIHNTLPMTDFNADAAATSTPQQSTTSAGSVIERLNILYAIGMGLLIAFLGFG